MQPSSRRHLHSIFRYIRSVQLIRMQKTYILGGFICLEQLILALILAQFKSGLNIYVAAGFITYLIFILLPFFEKNWSIGRRIVHCTVMIVVFPMVWTMGFMLADFRLIDRLF